VRDLNDPQLLGEKIIEMCKNGMKAPAAADYLYEDMSSHGWSFALDPGNPRDPLSAYTAASARRGELDRNGDLPPSQSGSQAVS